MMSKCEADFPKGPWSGSFTVVCFEDLPPVRILVRFSKYYES